MDRQDVSRVQIIRGNALALPLADDSVDLVVTSPPYFGLRSYQDGGEHRDRLGERVLETFGGWAERVVGMATQLHTLDGTEACACPEPTAPTTPGVVLDPFGGTGTTALVAHALGRHGISVDMSADYCRLAGWRTSDPKQQAKAARREYVPPREQTEGQLYLLEGIA